MYIINVLKRGCPLAQGRSGTDFSNPGYYYSYGVIDTVENSVHNKKDRASLKQDDGWRRDEVALLLGTRVQKIVE